MFSPGQQLLTGIAIGISKRNILYTLLPAPLNFIVLQIPCHPAISNPEFINCLIKELLYILKSATCNIFDIWGCRYLSKTTRFRKEP